MKPLLISKIRGKDKTPRHYFRYQVPGQTGKKKVEREVAMRAGSDQRLAEAEYRANIGLLKQGKDPYPAPVKTMAAKVLYIKSLATGDKANAPATIEGKEQTIDFALRWLETNEDIETLADLDWPACERYQAARKPVLSVASWQREVAYLRHFFKWARNQSPPLMTSDPGAKWYAPQSKTSATANKPILTEAEIEKLLKNMRPEVAAGWMYQVQTGVRPGEMWALKVGQLNFDERAATYIMQKTGRARTVSYALELKAKLKEMVKGRAPDELVFRNRDGEPWNRHTWRRTVYKAAHDAKMMVWDAEHHRIVSGRAPNPHLARHTVATLLARLPGMDVKTLMEIMGWRDAATAMKYIHANQTKIREFFDQIQKPKGKKRVQRASTRAKK